MRWRAALRILGAPLSGTRKLMAQALLAIASASTPAIAGEFNGYVFGGGSWLGGGFDNPPGRFEYCLMESENAQGWWLAIALFDDGTLSLAYRDVDFPVAQGASPTVTTAVDESVHRTVKAIGTENFLMLNLGQDPAFVRALQQGRILSFRSPGQSAAIGLYPNTGTVLAELQACLDFHLAAPSSPAASPTSRSKQTEESSTSGEEQEEDVLAALVLKA